MSTLVPSAKNDEFASPDSELYILSVPFSADNKNVINFANKTAQINAFKEYMSGKPHFHRTGLNIIRKDHSIYLREPFATLADEGYDIYQFNYLIYKNPELDNKWWFCFITNVEYQAKDVTRIDFVVDVWQTFHTDITYRKCMVERCHIPSSQDSFRLWNEPEPLNVIPYTESADLNDVQGGSGHTGDMWNTRFLLKAQSLPKKDGSDITFEYGGTTNSASPMNEDDTPFYLMKVESLDGTQPYYKNYSKILNTYNRFFSDHRQDVIECVGVPKWVYDNLNTTSASLGMQSIKYDATTGAIIPDTVSTGNVSIVSSNSTPDVVCGYTTMNNTKFTVSGTDYTPRNKKLMSSLCRTYVIYNVNGLKIILKPEDVLASYNDVNDLILLRCTTSAVSCNAIKFYMPTIRKYSENFMLMPYDVRCSMAYNENSGAALAVNALKSVFALTTGIMSTISGVSTASGFLGALGAQGSALRRGYKENKESGKSGWSYTQKSNRAQQAFNEANALKQKNEITMNYITGAEDIFEKGASLAENLQASTGGSSSSPDVFGFRPENMTIQIREVMPTLEQLRECDDFLDMYGYARNEILSLSSVISNRSNWNYVKTVNCNLSCNCATNYEMILRTIFNNGVTIWHSFDKLISGYNNADTDNKNT